MYSRCFTFLFLSVDVSSVTEYGVREASRCPLGRFWSEGTDRPGGSPGEPSSAWAAEETPRATEASSAGIIQAEGVSIC